MMDEFKRQRAATVRELAEKAIDPFIKSRLLNLAERYKVDQPPTRTPTTPIDLRFNSRGNGSER